MPDKKALAAKVSNGESKRRRESRSFTQGDSESVLPMSEREHTELVIKRIEEGRIDITSYEKDWLNCLFAFATTFGEGGRQYAQQISQFWVGKDGKSYSAADVDSKYDWCLANGRNEINIGTFMAIAKENGVDVSMPMGRYPEGSTPPASLRSTRVKKGSQQKAQDEATLVKQTKDFLSKLVQLRYNEITEKIEVRNIEVEGAPWVSMDDRTRDTLLTRLHSAGIKVRKSDMDTYLGSEDFAPAYNPFTSYMSGLPDWDPSQPDYITELFNHVVFDESYAKVSFYHKYCRKWFLNFVALLSGKITDNQLVLNFLGPHNVGKSFFCSHLMPPELAKYVHVIRPNDPIDKDQMLSLSSYGIIVLDEFTLTSKNSSTFKSMISATNTQIRGAYQRYSKTRKRWASFVANGNDIIYIVDTNGSRRYVSIKILSTRNIFEFPINYAGAFAQALYLIEQEDYIHYLLPEEVKELEIINQEHTEADLVAETISSLYRKPEEGENGISVSCSDIYEKVSLRLRGLKITSADIGKRMIKLGYTKRNHHGRSVYLVVEIPPADYGDECKREGEAICSQIRMENDAASAAAEAAREAQENIFNANNAEAPF